MKKIILDTNFLLIPIQFKVDIFSEIERICMFEYKLCIVDKAISELNEIAKKGNMENKLAAKVALKLVKDRKLEIIPTREGKVDDLILGLLDKDSILATQDAELRRKTKEKRAGIIVLRSRKHLLLNM